MLFLPVCWLLLFLSSCSKHTVNNGPGTGGQGGTGGQKTDTIPTGGYKLGWQSVLGGTDNDAATSIIPTRDSGYLVVGSTFSVNSGDVRNNAGIADMWIIKLGKNGDTLWTKTLGGSSYDYATGALATADGGYIVTGMTSSTGGIVGKNHGGWDGWIVKLASNGDWVWGTTVGGAQDDYVYGIAASPDGGYVFAGSTSSNDGGITGFHGTVGLSDDIWIGKLDGNGNLLWSKAKGGTKDDVARSIVATADGGYAVGGVTASNDGDLAGTVAYGLNDVCVMKVNAGGDITWIKTYGGSDQDGAVGMIAAADGGYLVTGSTASSNSGMVGANHGADDVWLLKLKPGGDTAWTKLLGGSGSDWATSVITTSYGGGGYALAGVTSSNNSGDVGPGHGNWDVWIVELDSARKILYQKPIGGTLSDVSGNGVAIVRAIGGGGYIVAGSSSSTDGDLQGQVRTGRTNDNFWIFQLH